MKHVFEFYGKDPQVICTTQPYADLSNAAPTPTYKGGRTDILIIDVTQADEATGQSYSDGDAVYLEGDIESIRKICQAILGQLAFLEIEDKKGLAT